MDGGLRWARKISAEPQCGSATLSVAVSRLRTKRVALSAARSSLTLAVICVPHGGQVWVRMMEPPLIRPCSIALEPLETFCVQSVARRPCEARPGEL